MVAAPIELSAGEARRMALRAQGMLGAEGRRGGPAGVLARLGAVQLDTISVLARSHELVAYARLGDVARERVEHAYWSRPAKAFEYWSHAACVLPVAEWPWFAFRRRAFRARGQRWHKVSKTVCDEVLDQVRSEGPLTTAELGGAKRGGEWWDWSDAKIAVEWLLDIGEIVCIERRGWRRVYDVAERALPPEVAAQDPDDAECLARLVGQAARAMGVATAADLADYHRLKRAEVLSAVQDAGLAEVRVEGWDAPAWADPEVLDAGAPRGRHRTTLLSPFDSLIWDRPRTKRLFGFHHRLEAYVPRPKRIHGYYVMPLLAGGRLQGRVDPKREGTTLHARQLSMDGPRAVEPMARALREAAAWVGCDAVALHRVAPPELAAPLRAALA